MFGNFDLDVIVRWAPILAAGMGLSLMLTGMAIVGGILIGTVLAMMRLSTSRLLSWTAGFYVNFLRSIPLILVIFWFYFAVPIIIGRPVGSFYSVLVAFTIFEAAYYCEIIRAGIMSVARGQRFAGQAIGLTPFQVARRVILPQAMRNMIPVLVTRSIIMFQDTSLVYVVGLRDFMTATDIVATRENRIVEMYLFAAAVYLVICLAGSLWAQSLQRKYAL
jgi:glutamate/aspartate transport system permease protein